MLRKSAVHGASAGRTSVRRALAALRTGDERGGGGGGDVRSLYIFPTGACDARHLGHRSQGALLGVVESVRCGSQDGMTWEAWEGAGIMAGELKL
jgi:hypothetical protein